MIIKLMSGTEIVMTNSRWDIVKPMILSGDHKYIDLGKDQPTFAVSAFSDATPGGYDPLGYQMLVEREAKLKVTGLNDLPKELTE